MELNDFIKKFADQFEDTDPSEITANTNFQELEEWDSLAALGIIALVKRNYGKTVNGREIRSCVSVQALFDLVSAK